MTSRPIPRLSRRSSLQSHDETRPPSISRTGTLTSLMLSRSRSQQSRAGPDDEEAALPASARRSRIQRGGTDISSDGSIGRLLGDERRLSQILHGTQARSMNLIGKSNPLYRWERYWKRPDELEAMTKPLRAYYERTNELIEQYMYIDCLLDSSIPHDLLNEYSSELQASAFRPVEVPDTVQEEHSSPTSSPALSSSNHSGVESHESTTPISYADAKGGTSASSASRHMHTPKDIFRPSETMPLLQRDDDDDDVAVARLNQADGHDQSGPKPNLPWLEDGDVDSDHPIVTLAIWVNMAANVILLAGKVAVLTSVSSMSVLASLVDAVLDFLSTAIIWTTTRLISSSQHDQNRYPVGRNRLEPLGVLVFSIVMITAFAQVALQSVQRLASPDHEILHLGIPATTIMVCTIVIKGAVWIWCRLVKNSSVRALANDAMTDVIFNTGSILFPLVGYYGQIWWLDALGGLLLSLVVMFTWSQTSALHVRNLTGFSAQPDERNLLLYLTMRFATAIRQIQNLRAYHAGDKLFVEVDIVLSANTPLKDSHDLSEVLTYFLEAVPIVDRAFVHVDYASYNAPAHMQKQRAT